VVLHVLREADGVVRIRGGERDESASIEVDSVVMDEVGILAWVQATGMKVDVLVRFVYSVNASHGPLAFGDLPLHVSSRAIHEIKVIPAIALRHPDDFLAVVQIVPEFL